MCPYYSRANFLKLAFAITLPLLSTAALTLAEDQSDKTDKAEKAPVKEVSKDHPETAPEQNVIDGWVADLDHAQLTKREEAQRNLLKSGKASIPALAKAALSGKREMIEKSISTLGKLAQVEDEATREAAKVTLRMLSESEQPSTAERAKLAMKAKEKESDAIKPFEGFDKPGNPFAGGGGKRSVSMTNINGRHSVNVKEAGLETDIQELSAGKIHVHISGGKEDVDLTVKDADELKAQAPDAYSLYKQYVLRDGSPLKPDVIGGANAQAIVGGAGAGSVNEMMAKQLEKLRQQFKDDAVMQQMLDQQIKMLEQE